MRGRLHPVALALPVAVAGAIFLPPLVDGMSLFLRVAWDSNNVFAFYPWNVFSSAEFAAGRFPLWNPFNACGAPHLANWQSAPLYPLHLLLFLHPETWAFDLLYLARFAVLGFGIWLLAREIGLSRWAASGATIAGTFSGYFIAYGPMVHMNVEILFPWALWLVAKGRGGLSMARWMGLTLAYALAFLGGNGESAFFVVSLSVLWALWLKIFDDGRMFLLAMLAAGAALLLASPQLTPFFEYFPKAWHIHPAGAGVYWLNAEGIYSLLFAVSGPGGGEYVPYIGAGVLLLAVVGAVPDRRSAFFLVFSALILAVVYGFPGVRHLTRLPGLSQIASYKYALAPFAIMAAILAGMGIEGLMRGQVTAGRVRRGALFIAVFALAFPLGAWIEGKSLNLAGTGVALAAIGAVALAVSATKRYAFVPVVLIVAVELIINAHSMDLKMILEPSKYAQRPEAEYLAEHHEKGRVACMQEIFPPNLNLIAGFSDINLLDALYPAGYVEKVSGPLGFEMEEATSWFKNHGYSFPVSPESSGHPTWRFLGVKYYYGERLRKEGMENPVGALYESPEKVSILTVNGEPARWSAESGPQDLLWKGDEGCRSLKVRINRLPGWRAWADGKELAVRRFGGMFMEVKPESPAQRVRLRYMPWGWKTGLWAGIASLVLLACFGGLLYYKRKR